MAKSSVAATKRGAGGRSAPGASAKPAKTGKFQAFRATKAAHKPESRPALPTGRDDAPAIALNLPPAKLSPAMTAYFRKCQDKLGFIPNVLVAYAFDNTKLEAFVALYNDLMLGRPDCRSLNAR